MKRSVLLPGLALLLAPLGARGDLIPDAVRVIQHEVRVEGMERFPGMRFVVYPVASGVGTRSLLGAGTRVLKPDEKQRFEWTRPRIYVVTGELPEDPDAERAFFADESLPRSQAQLRYIPSLPEYDPRVRIRTVYRIDEVVGALVRVTKTEEAWDADGNSLGRTVEQIPPKPKEEGEDDDAEEDADGEPEEGADGEEGDASARPAPAPATASLRGMRPLATLSGLALGCLVLLGLRRLRS